KTEGVDLDAIKTLTPEVALEYARKSYKTLHRDVAELAKLQLVFVKDRKVYSNHDLIRAFLPVRAHVSKASRKALTPTTTQRPKARRSPSGVASSPPGKAHR